jgi:hypothetical protein
LRRLETPRTLHGEAGEHLSLDPQDVPVTVESADDPDGFRERVFIAPDVEIIEISGQLYDGVSRLWSKNGDYHMDLELVSGKYP